MPAGSVEQQHQPAVEHEGQRATGEVVRPCAPDQFLDKLTFLNLNCGGERVEYRGRTYYLDDNFWVGVQKAIMDPECTPLLGDEDGRVTPEWRRAVVDMASRGDLWAARRYGDGDEDGEFADEEERDRFEFNMWRNDIDKRIPDLEDSGFGGQKITHRTIDDLARDAEAPLAALFADARPSDKANEQHCQYKPALPFIPLRDRGRFAP